MSRKIEKFQTRINSWKQKAIVRGDIARQQRKKIKSLEERQLKLQRENQLLKEKVKPLSKSLENEKQKYQKLLHKKNETRIEKEHIILISLHLHIVMSFGFRAIAKAWKVFGDVLGVKKTPCHQTIINWFMKLSIVRLLYPLPGNISLEKNNPRNNHILCIDESIAVTHKKAFAVLAVPVNHYKNKTGAPRLQDVRTLFVEVSSSWNAEKIQDLLEKILSVHGVPCAFIRDGGSNLKKALNDARMQDEKVPVISDISHFCANAFKHVYEKDKDFIDLMKECGKISTKMKQTVFGCLAPPKVRQKARFMNISAIIHWAIKLLALSERSKQRLEKPPSYCSAKLYERTQHLLEKFSSTIKELTKKESLIKKLHNEIEITNSIMKSIKNEGLNIKNFKLSMIALEGLSKDNPIRLEMKEWLVHHLDIAKSIKLENVGMPVTSDTIETLFSHFKGQKPSSHQDPVRGGFKLLGKAGELTMEDVKKVMEVPHKTLQELQSSFSSCQKNRRTLLGKEGDLSILGEQEIEKDSLIMDLFLNSGFRPKPKLSQNFFKDSVPQFDGCQDDEEAA